jgi:hypothetical protein
MLAALAGEKVMVKTKITELYTTFLRV